MAAGDDCDNDEGDSDVVASNCCWYLDVENVVEYGFTGVKTVES